MPTTQSEDPNEKVDHPRHYNQSPSGVETIEIIEHLPANLAMAIKYVWRCGLKQSETPLRDLRSARWYAEREQQRIYYFDIPTYVARTDVVWRSLAKKVIESDPGSYLARCLDELLVQNLTEMIGVIDEAIESQEK